MHDRIGLLLHTLWNKNVGYVLLSQRLILTLQKSNVIYCLTCPGCNEKYIGKTDRNFLTRLHEQGSRDDQPLYQHLTKCEDYNGIVNLIKLPDTNSTTVAVDKKEYMLQAVLIHLRLVDSWRNWSQLLFFEAFYIKTLAPKRTDGLRGSHELLLFK